MELLNIQCLGKSLRLEGSMAGWQILYWDNTPVSRIDASANYNGASEHSFELKAGEQIITCRLAIDLNWQPFTLQHKLFIDDHAVSDGSRNSKDIERQQPVEAPQPAKKPFNIIGLAALGLKLLKSAKLIKVVLAGASLAAYSWFFSLQFALALIACLVVHEYGHIRAMKHFGMQTKGIYLIPFLGGLALSDEKINTRWQDVVISLMGPVFGLGMSVLCLIAYWITGEAFFAGLSAFNALLNLFNLLPILPLDGGHVLKSIAFSMNSLVGLLLCAAAAGAGIFISYSLGLALLGFLLIVGCVEIGFEWRSRYMTHLLPLDRYGQIFSTVWYLATVIGLVAIIWYFAGTGDALLGLPLQVLRS